VVAFGCKSQFDDGPVRQKVRAGNIESLGHGGAAIRRSAKSSIKKRKKPAAKGTPPHTQTRRLPRSLLYAVERNREFAVVGPASRFGRNVHKVAALHEFSGFVGKFRNPRRRIRKLGGGGEVAIATRRRRRRGRFVKDNAALKTLRGTRQGNVRVQFAKLRTPRQVRKANRINEELYGPLTSQANYPKRPFLGPALKRVAPRLPEHWRGIMLN
jgi:hypothetical protein